MTGDFNGDGRTDLAVANSDDNDVSILLGNGDGTFQNQVTYAVGSDPVALVTGDFNGDGRTDLAVANSDDNDVSILLGNGDGTFQNQVTYAVGSCPDALVTGDFNGDGRTDLAVANSGSNDVSILLGNGDGTFTDPGQFATTPHSTPLVADVNGDGTDDVLVVDGAGNILYRQGIPGQPGTFEPPVTINPGFPSRDIAWVPNTDQGPVLASVDAHDNADLALRLPRRWLRPEVGSLATGHLPAQIIAADLNGDGWTDLVVRNAGDGTLSVFFGTEFVGPVVNPEVDSPALPASGHASGRPGRLRRRGGRYDGKRQARSRGHQQAQRSGERPAATWAMGPSQPPSLTAPGPGCRRSIPAARPRSRAWRRRRAWPPGRSRRAVRPTW